MGEAVRWRRSSRAVAGSATAVAFVGTLALTGCGAGRGPLSTAKRVSPTATPVQECTAAPPDATRLTIPTAYGVRLGAIGLGPASTTTVVLVHGAGQDACAWLPVMRELVEAGVRSVALDLRGRGASEGSANDLARYPTDLDATVTALSHAPSVVLVGTSLGAATVMAAEPLLSTPAKAVVAVSPPLRLGTIDVLERARRARAPLTLVASVGDTTYAANASTLAAAAPTATGPALKLEGKEHGLRLVLGTHRSQIVALIREADAALAPVG